MRLVPDGFCQCGCGERTSVAKTTNNARGHVKGSHLRYLKGHRRRSEPVPLYRVDELTGCWVWQRFLDRGYGRIRRSGRCWPAHVWFYTQAKGPVPAGMEVDHLCRVRACVNPDHLEPVTPLENMRRCAATRLNEGIVAEIKGSSARNKDLAAKYAVDPSTISHIRRGEIWSDVDAA